MTTEPLTTGPPTTASRGLVLTVMCAGYFLVLLDVTAINVALPQLGADLGTGVAGLQWVVDGYAVALAALLLSAGALGDLRGHKAVVSAGLVVFGLGSLACGLAPGIGVLVAARVVQGMGAALLLPGTLAIISRAYPERREQARAIGVWAGVGSIALPAGPLIAGLLVQGAGWRWVFFVNIPIVAVAAVVAARTAPHAEDLPSGRRLDRAGTGLAAVMLAAATFTVIEVGHAGFGVTVAAGAVIAIVSVVAFVRRESRADDPMLPLGLLRRPPFATANAVAGAMNLGTLGLLFLLTLFLQTVQHRSALSAGLAVLPLFLPLSVLAPFAGRLAARVGPKPVMVTGLLVAAAGVALVWPWSTDTAWVALVPALLCWGIGLGLLTPAVVAAAIAAAPAERAGLASGVNNAARQAGGAIGIAAYGALAGSPDGGRFLTGLHVAGLITALLFVAAAFASAAFVPARRG